MKNDFFSQLLPCLTGEAIASHPEIKRLVYEIQSLISAPSAIYTALYETTLCRWMAFCQAMPQDIRQPHPYSLLKTSLETAIAVLKIRRGKMIPPQSNSEAIAEQEPLWTYAIFTASLFVFLPDLQADRTVELYKSSGQEKIGLWHPFVGCLYEQKTSYKILPQPHPMIIHSVFCLASYLGKIIPAIGCRWLTENPVVWRAWWEVINKIAGSNNILWVIIKEACGFKQKMEDFIPPVSKSEIQRENNSLIEVASPRIDESESSELIADQPEPNEIFSPLLTDFNQWIVKNCSPSGALNGKKVFMRTQSGVLIRFKRLEDFIGEYPEYESVEAVLAQLSEYLKQEAGTVVLRYHFLRSNAPEELMRGILLLEEYLCESLRVLPAHNQFIDNLTLKTT